MNPTAGIVAVMRSGPGLLPLAVVYTVTNVAEHVALAALGFRFLPGLRLSWRLVDRATLREVRGYSTDAFLAMLAGRVTVQTGAILVGLFLPAGAVTFYATAARLVAGAAVVITVDTMIAHLAGTLGRPTWLLLKRDPDWRWAPDADTTPWYPSMRLYRQRRPGGWGEVVDRVRADLERADALTAGRRAG